MENYKLFLDKASSTGKKVKVITVLVTININWYVLNYDSMVGISVLSCLVVIRTRVKEYNLSCFWRINCWRPKESWETWQEITSLGQEGNDQNYVIYFESRDDSIPYKCMHTQSFQSCLTLYNPMDYSLPGSSAYKILQARILKWVDIYSSRGSSWPRSWTCISCVLHWRWIFYCWANWGNPVFHSYQEIIW